MNTLKKAFLLLFSFASFNSFTQTISTPSPWKINSVTKYELQQQNIGGIYGEDHFEQSQKTFQIKVVKEFPKPKAGFLVEWKYLSYITAATDTLEESCPIIDKKFLLQTPIFIRIDEKGSYQGLADKLDLQKKYMAFYAKSIKEGSAPFCMDMLKSNMARGNSFSDIFDAIVPEIQRFFTAFSLLPCDEKGQSIDTTEKLRSAGGVVAEVPKTFRLKPETIGNNVKISFEMKVSEKEYKKLYETNTRKAWDDEGFSTTDSSRIRLEEKLASFQPKNRQKLEATFNKTDGSLSSFEFIVDEWLMMKGGETQKYFFKKI